MKPLELGAKVRWIVFGLDVVHLIRVEKLAYTMDPRLHKGLCAKVFVP